jgi:Tol biopolymer transport system component
LFWNVSGKTAGDIWAVPVSTTDKPFPVLHTAAYEDAASFSPDDHWIAYASDEGCVPYSVEKRLGVALVQAINCSTVRFHATA